MAYSGGVRVARRGQRGRAGVRLRVPGAVVPQAKAHAGPGGGFEGVDRRERAALDVTLQGLMLVLA
jgi:hypothetical protein